MLMKRYAIRNAPISDQRTNTIAFVRFLADLLDKRFTIPGTQIRFGLDPVLGLIPGIGDTLANITGATILIFAARSRVPKIILLRMALNIAINSLIGAIPLLGDLFSIWFKSNVKNVQLLEKYLNSETHGARAVDWLIVTGLLLGLAFVLVMVAIAITWLVTAVLKEM